jgi:nitrate/nitrite transport system substrate-binding protein
MAAAGIDPDRDVQLVVIPPPRMVENLESKNIDGYCVGEPWNARAVTAGIGHTLITSYEIWNNSPEKVFGVNREWAEAYPKTHRATLMALIEAAQWIDRPENRDAVARIIARPAYVDAPQDVVKMSMTGTFRYAAGEAPRPLPDFNVFYRYAATFPWRSHALWFLTQMVRWGQVGQSVDMRQVATDVYRPDLYREAARALGVPAPSEDYKVEGGHAGPWTLTEASAPIVMGPDRFFDGRLFDPVRPIDYLAGFEIRNPSVTLAALAEANESRDG